MLRGGRRGAGRVLFRKKHPFFARFKGGGTPFSLKKRGFFENSPSNIAENSLESAIDSSVGACFPAKN
jgi:hypothetical protein